VSILNIFLVRISIFKKISIEIILHRATFI